MQFDWHAHLLHCERMPNLCPLTWLTNKILIAKASAFARASLTLSFG